MGGIICQSESRRGTADVADALPEAQPEEPLVFHFEQPSADELTSLDNTWVDGKQFPSELLRTIMFQFKVHESNGATFANVMTSSDGGVLVVNTIEKTSALAVAVCGSPGLTCGDVILKIGGVGGSSDWLLERLRRARAAGGPIEILCLKRPQSFDVELQRTGNEKLGLMVAEQNGSVAITRVLDEGTISSWNTTNWMKRVTVTDKITAVNGLEKPAKEMMGLMQQSWKKQFVKLRITC